MKFNSKITFTVFFSITLLLSPSFSVFSQEKKVKWQGLSGKNDEFHFLMPEGYSTIADGNYYMGTGGGSVFIEKELTTHRFINDVILLMKYFEGNAKEIQKETISRQKDVELVKEDIINGFSVKFYSVKSGNKSWKIQHYQIKNRLYTLQAIANDENNPIMRDFFESVRLVNKNQIAAPNIPNASGEKLNLKAADIVEKPVNKDSETQAVESDELARNIIFLFKPRPRLKDRGNFVSGKVKLRVLFSSNGKIGRIEIISSPSQTLSDAAIESTNQIIFIPAEKDGKFVSVYKVVEYSFATG